MEYVAWLLLPFVGCRRLERLSVGVAQIQLRHWRHLSGWNSVLPSVERMYAVASLERNFDLCGQLVPQGLTLREVACVYRGEARSYHLAVLEAVSDWLRGRSRSRRGV